MNHFAAEMDHFSECVLSDKDPPTPGEEGLADMRVIAAIEEAARTGQREGGHSVLSSVDALPPYSITRRKASWNP